MRNGECRREAHLRWRRGLAIQAFARSIRPAELWGRSRGLAIQALARSIRPAGLWGRSRGRTLQAHRDAQPLRGEEGIA